MDNREQFEDWMKENQMCVEYNSAKAIWQACAEQKDAEIAELKNTIKSYEVALANATAYLDTAKARIAQLEKAFYVNMIRAFPSKSHDEIADEIAAINCSPDTRLSEHDKEVEARERERCAMVCGMTGEVKAAKLLRSMM